MNVRFQVLTAADMKRIVFWDVAPCELLKIDRRLRSVYCLHHQGDDGNRKYVSDETTWSSIPEYTHSHDITAFDSG